MIIWRREVKVIYCFDVWKSIPEAALLCSALHPSLDRTTKGIDGIRELETLHDGKRHCTLMIPVLPPRIDSLTYCTQRRHFSRFALNFAITVWCDIGIRLRNDIPLEISRLFQILNS